MTAMTPRFSGRDRQDTSDARPSVSATRPSPAPVPCRSGQPPPGYGRRTRPPAAGNDRNSGSDRRRFPTRPVRENSSDRPCETGCAAPFRRATGPGTASRFPARPGPGRIPQTPGRQRRNPSSTGTDKDPSSGSCTRPGRFRSGWPLPPGLDLRVPQRTPSGSSEPLLLIVQPLTLPAVRPWTRKRSNHRKMKRTGTVAITAPAMRC